MEIGTVLDFLVQFKGQVFNTDHPFEKKALALFQHQAEHNLVYKEYISALGINTNDINVLHQIPFLPIEFFKTRTITTGKGKIEDIFTSSGTTGTKSSKHYVTDLQLYVESFTRCFEYFYGEVRDYRMFALLPDYLERKGSSLVYMIDNLIQLSGDPDSGFFLDDTNKLIDLLKQRSDYKTLLFGASFALLDLAETYNLNLSDCIVMETGGMKGRREEITHKALHELLCKRFNVKTIHSEYGMTELMSQAYSRGKGFFRCPFWMKVLTRDVNDPYAFPGYSQAGAINIIDLANMHSCAFIATDDLGRVHEDGSFEVLGRLDNSDIRGCNLLID